MDLGFAGKACLVAGASRGIGQAIAHALAREGARVAAVARGKAELDAVRLSGRHRSLEGSLMDAEPVTIGVPKPPAPLPMTTRTRPVPPFHAGRSEPARSVMPSPLKSPGQTSCQRLALRMILTVAADVDWARPIGPPAATARDTKREIARSL